MFTVQNMNAYVKNGNLTEKATRNNFTIWPNPPNLAFLKLFARKVKVWHFWNVEKYHLNLF